MDHGDWIEVNRSLWDERVPIHVAGDFYDVAGFLAGRSSLRAFELAELGSVVAPGGRPSWQSSTP